MLISRSIKHRGPALIPAEVKVSMTVKLSLAEMAQDQSMEKE